MDFVAWIAAIDPLFPDHPKSLHLISIYSSGLMISIGSLRLLKHASIADNSVKRPDRRLGSVYQL